MTAQLILSVLAFTTVSLCAAALILQQADNLRKATVKLRQREYK